MAGTSSWGTYEPTQEVWTDMHENPGTKTYQKSSRKGDIPLSHLKSIHSGWKKDKKNRLNLQGL
jgi:hypothetical protein